MNSPQRLLINAIKSGMDGDATPPTSLLKNIKIMA